MAWDRLRSSQDCGRLAAPLRRATVRSRAARPPSRTARACACTNSKPPRSGCQSRYAPVAMDVSRNDCCLPSPTTSHRQKKDTTNVAAKSRYAPGKSACRIRSASPSSTTSHRQNRHDKHGDQEPVRAGRVRERAREVGERRRGEHGEEQRFPADERGGGVRGTRGGGGGGGGGGAGRGSYYIYI